MNDPLIAASPAVAAVPATQPRGAQLWMPALIIVCGALAYSSSFGGAFVFDDIPHITENPGIRSLWPIGPVIGLSLRPVLFYSLALNYAISGLEPWSYHLVNLLIHLGAALALFGVVRRSFAFDGMHRWVALANPFAFAVSVVWVVHPLTTQAVTYVVQRSESMAALFYLLALYAFIRAIQSERPAPWYAGSMIAMAVGLGSKEIAVTAPFVILLYDRCFVAGSFSRAMRRRWYLYGTLAAAVPLVFAARWVAGLPNKYVFASVWGGLTGQQVVPIENGFTFAPTGVGDMSSFEYLATQPEVVSHYLRLALWPRPLVLDYGWLPVADWRDGMVAGFGATAALVAVLWLLRRRPELGFVAASFVILLAPSSSLMPLHDLGAEHRMYLPLAAVLVLAAAAVVGMHHLKPSASRLPRGVAYVLLALLVVALGSLTFARNRDYHSRLRIWEDVVSKRPENPRGHFNLGAVLQEEGRHEAAVAHLEAAVALSPSYARALSNLGAAHVALDGLAAGEPYYRRALGIDPQLSSAHLNLGNILADRGDLDGAIRHYDAAIRFVGGKSQTELGRDRLLARIYNNLGMVRVRMGQLESGRRAIERSLAYDGDYVAARNNLGLVAFESGDLDAAIEFYEAAIAVDPDRALSYGNLGRVLVHAGRFEAGAEAYRAAIGREPDNATFHNDLGAVLVRMGDPGVARRSYDRALLLNPELASAHNNLGLLLAAEGETDAAVDAFREAVRLDPGLAQGHDNMGTAYAAAGRHQEAVAAYLQALFVDREFARAHNNLGVVLVRTGRAAEAEGHFREAIRLDPAHDDARANLRLLIEGRGGR